MPPSLAHPAFPLLWLPLSSSELLKFKKWKQRWSIICICHMCFWYFGIKIASPARFVHYSLHMQRIQWSLWGSYVCFTTTSLEYIWGIYCWDYMCPQCVFGIPVLPADLIALSPGYRSPAGLGNCPLRPLAYAVRAPGARNIGSNVQKWCYQHRDVKRVITSRRTDVMSPYKKSHPVRNAVLLGYRLPIELSAGFVQPCAIPEPFRRLSLFSCGIELRFSYYSLVVSETRCIWHHAGPSELYWWSPLC